MCIDCKCATLCSLYPWIEPFLLTFLRSRKCLFLDFAPTTFANKMMMKAPFLILLVLHFLLPFQSCFSASINLPLWKKKQLKSGSSSLVFPLAGDVYPNGYSLLCNVIFMSFVNFGILIIFRFFFYFFLIEVQQFLKVLMGIHSFSWIVMFCQCDFMGFIYFGNFDCQWVIFLIEVHKFLNCTITFSSICVFIKFGILVVLEVNKFLKDSVVALSFFS